MPQIDSDLYAEAPVLRARMEVPPEALDPLLDALWGLEPPVGSFEDLETGRAFVDCYAVDRDALARTADAMREAAAAQGFRARTGPRAGNGSSTSSASRRASRSARRGRTSRPTARTASW